MTLRTEQSRAQRRSALTRGRAARDQAAADEGVGYTTAVPGGSTSTHVGPGASRSGAPAVSV
jgi:hypothetical protein